ncbi:hypothetical protein [Methylomonas albis]|nr:hypothetical protein [Methylomonas albis]
MGGWVNGAKDFALNAGNRGHRSNSQNVMPNDSYWPQSIDEPPDL